jgi:hypothetical protein
MGNDEFYIGWMQKAPASFLQFIRKYLLIVFIGFIVVASLVVLYQKKFSTAVFEFGKTTAVTGIYKAVPVPHLLIKSEGDYIMVPLVGYGKHGAAGVMNDLAAERNTSLDGKEIELRGTLLYGDGKMLMQVDKAEAPLLHIFGGAGHLPENHESRSVSLQGEIIDPKCFFGVMKPGEGKAHKDCAIRCILGGIPPVLKTTDELGNNSYVLLTSSSANINEWVRDVVASSARLTGILRHYGSWQVMDVESIHNTSGSELQAMTTPTCGSACCKQ